MLQGTFGFQWKTFLFPHCFVFPRRDKKSTKTDYGSFIKESTKLEKIWELQPNSCHFVSTPSHHHFVSHGACDIPRSNTYFLGKYFLKRGTCLKQRLHLHMCVHDGEEEGRWTVISSENVCLPVICHLTFHWPKQVTWLSQPQREWESGVLPYALLCRSSAMKGRLSFTLLFPWVLANDTGRRLQSLFQPWANSLFLSEVFHSVS